MKKIVVIIFVSILATGCNKKTAAPIVLPNKPASINHYSFTLGSTSFSSQDIYGQRFTTSSDTLLQMNCYNTTDTISGGFTLHAPVIGSYTHTNVPTSSPGYAFVVGFGNPGNPNSMFYSKSGTLTITKYDNVNMEFEGTFSGIMYLSTNPSYTMALTNGSFYYMYQ